MASLTDLKPYVWYDIALYPSQNSYTNGPIVDVICKFYMPSDDTFRYYKVRDTYLIAQNNREDEASYWSNVPSNHRVIAFMHDGGDVSASAPAPSRTHPSFCTISEPQRIRAEQRMNAMPLVFVSDQSLLEPAWREEGNPRLELPKVNEIVRKPDTTNYFRVMGVRNLGEAWEILISPDDEPYVHTVDEEEHL